MRRRAGKAQAGFSLVEFCASLTIFAVLLSGAIHFFSRNRRQQQDMASLEDSSRDLTLPVESLRADVKLAYRIYMDPAVVNPNLVIEYRRLDPATNQLKRVKVLYESLAATSTLQRTVYDWPGGAQLGQQSFPRLLAFSWCLDDGTTECPAVGRIGTSSKRMIAEFGYQGVGQSGARSLAFVIDAENLPFDCRTVTEPSLLRAD